MLLAWRLLSRSVLAVWLLTGTALAQRSAEADTLFTQARSDAETARQSYAGILFTIDQALWRSAVTGAERALELSPNDLEITLFLAESYSALNWHIRAWEYWLEYLALGGSLESAANAPKAAQFAQAGNELGFARYEAGELTAALGYYQRVAETLPDNVEALTWLGRIYFEQGELQTALPYWQRLTELEPENEGFAYYLDLSEEQLEVGTAASAAFREGLRAYEAGDFGAALQAFEVSLGENGDFIQAYVWAGRTSLELGQATKARRYWERVLALDPSDDRARYFAERAATEERWGADASDAFYEGEQLYAAGDFTGAAERFDAATLHNPAYHDAFVWAARSYQEAGDPASAVRYWRAALALDPNDERTQYFLDLAEQDIAYGGRARRAFTLGIEQFEGANLLAAEDYFLEAVEADEAFTEAWAWLGRVYFTRADYTGAQEAYERALGLEPDNSDYRFFAEESAFLAGEGGVDEGD